MKVEDMKKACKKEEPTITPIQSLLSSSNPSLMYCEDCNRITPHKNDAVIGYSWMCEKCGNHYLPTRVHSDQTLPRLPGEVQNPPAQKGWICKTLHNGGYMMLRDPDSHLGAIED